MGVTWNPILGQAASDLDCSHPLILLRYIDIKSSANTSFWGLGLRLTMKRLSFAYSWKTVLDDTRSRISFGHIPPPLGAVWQAPGCQPGLESSCPIFGETNPTMRSSTWLPGFCRTHFTDPCNLRPPPRDGSWKWLTLHPDRPPHPWPCPPCPPKETGYKYRSVQKKHTVTFNIPYPIKTRSLSTDSYYIKMCTFQIIGADLPMVLNMVHPSAPNVRPLKRWRVAPGRPTCGDPKILKIRFCCWGRLRPQ